MDQSAPRRLTRSRTDRIIAGVCGGLAQYFSVDPTLVRLIFGIFVFGMGSGILLYILLWIIMPEEGKDESSTTVEQRVKEVGAEMKASAEKVAADVRSRSTPDGLRKFFALVLIGIGTVALLNSFLPWRWVRWDAFWGLVVLGLGLFMFFRPRS